MLQEGVEGAALLRAGEALFVHEGRPGGDEFLAGVGQRRDADLGGHRLQRRPGAVPAKAGGQGRGKAGVRGGGGQARGSGGGGLGVRRLLKVHS